jgi:2'-hydroxyisoflavone reductase
MTQAEKKLKILILGGTAFLGPAVVHAARRRGHELTLFNRGRTNPGLFPDIETLIGDRDGKLDPLKGRDWDKVVDTSGYFPRLVKDSASLLADHVGQYVFISSISVYASFDKPGMDENSPVGTIEDPTIEKITEGSYGPLKALCEQAAEKAMPGRVTNIRPGLIVGPRDRSDRFTYWPVRVSRGGEVLAPNSPKDGIQIMDVNDLGEWIVYCLEQKVVGVYNACSPPGWLDMGKLLDTCKRVSGSDATFTWAPSKFLEDHEVQGWSEMTCWMPPEGEYAGFSQVKSERAVHDGLAFRPISETVRDTLDWWRTLPQERREKMRAGLAAEKEEKVLAAWHDMQKG